MFQPIEKNQFHLQDLQNEANLLFGGLVKKLRSKCNMFITLMTVLCPNLYIFFFPLTILFFYKPLLKVVPQNNKVCLIISIIDNALLL
jgi:hypothetical protein